MARFAAEHGGDPRFAVLPGVLHRFAPRNTTFPCAPAVTVLKTMPLVAVLHSEPVWGNGTTEYALDALLAAPHQQTKLGV